MKKGQRLWTREELMLTINLYCKLPFGKLHSKNPEVVQLAQLIGRTENAVAYKLVNFASLDPSLQKRGIKGAANVSKLDIQIWGEFYNNWEELAFESEVLLAEKQANTLNNIYPTDEKEYSGKTRTQLVKARINQSFFRKSILAAYNNKCCITGIQQPELLIAGHIIPWSVNEKQRMNPRNGLAINALHDKAFESGLITITPEYKVKVSSRVKSAKSLTSAMEDYFLKYDGQDMILPSRFLPDPEFLKHHYDNKFII